MDIELAILAALAAALALGVALPVVWYHRRRDRIIREKLDRAQRLGLNETLSLHPSVDEGKCIGCEECVRNCPEQDVLATYRHKAVVVDAVECVGHGLCERVCPVQAITLVIGTERRGVEVPRLTEHFETSVPGVFVAGELGGMGLIRNAVWQASQAVAHIARLPRQAADGTDLLIVGAGPAGLAAALAATQARLRYRMIEQGEVGGSILHYPRRKLVMMHPVAMPLGAQLPYPDVEKEVLLDFWLGLIERHGVNVEARTRFDRVAQEGPGFAAQTSAGTIRAGRVLLALGRRGTPRKLEVPGEDTAKVFYRLLEPEKFAGLGMVVVGGGSAAIEAALALAAQPGTRVTLCHRRAEFAGARAALIDQLLEAEAAGRLEILRHARVTAIAPDHVCCDVSGTAVERPNDFVVVLIGGVPPYQLLTDSGVDLEQKFGVPLFAAR